MKLAPRLRIQLPVPGPSPDRRGSAGTGNERGENHLRLDRRYENDTPQRG